MKPFPDSLQLSLESAERLKSRHPERYADQVDAFEAKLHDLYRSDDESK